MKDDRISREAAIDALSTPHGILYPIRTVEELPSAQPENMCVNLDIQKIATHKSDFNDLNDFDEPKSACGDCQEFDCYGCEHKEESK